MAKKLTYDSAFAELNEILETLQDENTGLDDISVKITRAKELSDFCHQKLRTLEEDIAKIENETTGEE